MKSKRMEYVSRGTTRHMRGLHKPNLVTFRCNQCMFTSRKQDKLKRHNINYHSGWVCTITCSSRYILRVVKKMVCIVYHGHCFSNEFSPIACKICGKKITPQRMSRHLIRIHGKPQCSIASKRINQTKSHGDSFNKRWVHAIIL